MWFFCLECHRHDGVSSVPVRRDKISSHLILQCQEFLVKLNSCIYLKLLRWGCSSGAEGLPSMLKGGSGSLSAVLGEGENTQSNKIKRKCLQ